MSERLPRLIEGFSEKLIDGASYRLRIGPEIYVSPSGLSKAGNEQTKVQLKANEGFVVPAGQFGFLLTEEVIQVPRDALAFITLRARYKFRGLVNVSGFHVDPGWRGRLVFAVYNAGPAPVHLSRGEECFQIWYSELDSGVHRSRKNGYNQIPTEIITPIAGEVQSFAGLLEHDEVIRKQLGDRISKIERDHAIMWWVGGAIFVLLAGIASGLLVFLLNAPQRQAVPAYPAPVSISPAQVPEPRTTGSVRDSAGRTLIPSTP